MTRVLDETLCTMPLVVIWYLRSHGHEVTTPQSVRKRQEEYDSSSVEDGAVVPFH